MIIRAIQAKYSKCSIISVLQSSQREYTEKMQVIQEICGHYDIPIADTIAPFNVDEDTYNSLSSDGVHLNEEGMKVYFETIKTVIESHLGEEYKSLDIAPLNAETDRFDNFLWVGTEYSGTMRHIEKIKRVLRNKISGKSLDFSVVGYHIKCNTRKNKIATHEKSCYTGK